MEESWKITCPLDKDQVTKAVKALQEYMSKKQNKDGEKNLLEEHNSVQLVVSVHKIPAVKDKSVFIKLPHEIYSKNHEICLFTRDIDVDDTEKSVEHYQNLFREKGITCITKIMPLREVRLDYRSYDSRRKLVDMYDLFICDKSLTYRLSKLLGKYLFEKRKHPWPIDMQCDDLKKEFTETVGKTRWFMLGNGSSSIMAVAKTNFSVGQIVDNIMTCAVEVAKHAPRGWNNVCALNVKTGNSIALPVYYNDKPEDISDMDQTELEYLRYLKRKREQKKAMWNMVGLGPRKRLRKWKSTSLKKVIAERQRIKK